MSERNHGYSNTIVLRRGEKKVLPGFCKVELKRGSFQLRVKKGRSLHTRFRKPVLLFGDSDFREDEGEILHNSFFQITAGEKGCEITFSYGNMEQGMAMIYLPIGDVLRR